MKYLRTTMPDGSKWDVPVMVIAINRAEHYKDEFGGNSEKSLREDTWLLFEEDDYEIKDWAVGNMNWNEVVSRAKKVEQAENEVDYQEGWINGEKEIIEY